VRVGHRDQSAKCDEADDRGGGYHEQLAKSLPWLCGQVGVPLKELFTTAGALSGGGWLVRGGVCARTSVEPTGAVKLLSPAGHGRSPAEPPSTQHRKFESPSAAPKCAASPAQV
jgi:hypothetical protein